MVYYTSLQDAYRRHAKRTSSSSLLSKESSAVAAAAPEKSSLPLPFIDQYINNRGHDRIDYDPTIAEGGHAYDGKFRPSDTTTSRSSRILSVYKNPLWSEQHKRLCVLQGKEAVNTAEPLEEDRETDPGQAIGAIHGHTAEQEGDHDDAVNSCNEKRHLPFLSSPRFNNITESAMSTSGSSSTTSACEFGLIQKLEELHCSPGSCRSFKEYHSPRLIRKPLNSYQRNYMQQTSDQQYVDSETFCREQNDEYHAGENKSQQMQLTSGFLDELESHCSTNDIHRSWLPNQQAHEISGPNGENATKCNDIDSQWYDHEDYKGRIDTLSSQEVDFLFQHSDVLAEFEREEYCNLEKTVKSGIKTYGRDALDPALALDLIPSRSTHKGKDQEEKKYPQETKEPTCFDDTSSWSTNNSDQAMTLNQLSEALNTTTLDIDRVSNASRKHPHHATTTKELLNHPKESTNQHPPPHAESSKESLGDASQIHKDDSKVEDWKHETIGSKINENVFAGDQLVHRKEVEALQRELLELKKENISLERSLKENEQIMENLAKEKVLWEQKKLSDISMFNRFKEEETRRLRRERSKLEKQAKLLSHLPSKKERSEIEELRNKIASISEDHFKKDSLQRLTINRLRRTISDLTEQIRALQEEVKRYEGFLQAEWDTMSLKGEVCSTRKLLNRAT